MITKFWAEAMGVAWEPFEVKEGHGPQYHVKGRFSPTSYGTAVDLYNIRHVSLIVDGEIVFEASQHKEPFAGWTEWELKPAEAGAPWKAVSEEELRELIISWKHVVSVS